MSISDIVIITEPPHPTSSLAPKLPEHDGPKEICIMFEIGDLQVAESRSIFVTVQATNGTNQSFVGK